jgi:hypothetical protein
MIKLMLNRTLVAGTITILLSGCAQTMFRITKAPPNKDGNLQSLESMQCNEQSRIIEPFNVLFCGIGAPICSNIRDNRYKECMSKLGYEVKEVGN